MHDVFISYSHKDKTVADAICNHLEGRGIRCWYAPRDITPASEWGMEILKGIEAAKIMVLVFTKDANLSQQVLREVNNAVNSGLSIIPFRLTEEEPTAGMKYYLSTVHWMDAMNDELEHSIARLGDLCQAILEKKPMPENASVSGLSVAEKSSVAAATPQKGTRGTRKAAIGVIAGVVILAVAVIIAAVILPARSRNGDTQSQADNVQTTGTQSPESTADVSGSGDTQAGSERSAMSSEEPGAGNEDTGADNEGSSVSSEDSKENDQNSETGSEDENKADTSQGAEENLGNSFILGNNQSNIMNGGYLAYDGEYYYYRSNDAGKMFRMKEDGSEKEQLTDTEVSAISVLDGYIYFVSESSELMRMKTDGTEQTLLFDQADQKARIIGDRIYFPDYGISSVTLEGTDEVRYNDMLVYDTCLDGTYQYYADPEHNVHLYRAKYDGSEAECLYAHETLSLRIAGKYLFFYDGDNGYEMAYDLTTGRVTSLFADAANSPVITKDGIYSVSGSQQLVFTPFGAMGVQRLTDEWVESINVAGDKIFYMNRDDGKYYIMDLDGSNKMET